MRTIPSIRQPDPTPSMFGLALVGFELWRLRRITAGLTRANAGGDSEAAARWFTRGTRAVADLDRAQSRLYPRRRPRCSKTRPTLHHTS